MIDNDLRHTATVIEKWLQSKEKQEVMKVIVWPQHSPDLNIIEHVWDYMRRQRDVKTTTSTEYLWLVPKGIWNNLQANFLQKMCASVEELMQFSWQRVVTSNIDFIQISLLFIH